MVVVVVVVLLRKKKNSYNLFLSIHRQKTALQVFLFYYQNYFFFWYYNTGTGERKYRELKHFPFTCLCLKFTLSKFPSFKYINKSIYFNFPKLTQNMKCYFAFHWYARKTMWKLKVPLLLAFKHQNHSHPLNNCAILLEWLCEC